MPLSKAPHADLRRTAFLRAQVAALLALCVPLVAFHVDVTGDEPSYLAAAPPIDLIDMVPPPPTRHENPKPPPPPRPPVLIEVPNEVLVDDVPLDFSEEPPESSPLPPPDPIEDELEEAETNETFIVAEQMPELLPSEPEAMRALQGCIRYPEMAKRAEIEGRVFLQFVVDKEGRVTEPFVARGIGGGADEEALRCVREVRFTPGYQRGQPVRVKFSLPVTFRLR